MRRAGNHLRDTKGTGCNEVSDPVIKSKRTQKEGRRNATGMHTRE